MAIPFSIAAWRTVLPFSTVIGRPSIVSDTVSIRIKDITVVLTTGSAAPRVQVSAIQFAFPGVASMDATRTRLSFAGDWLMAVAFLIGTVLVALLIVRELRGAGAA